MRAEDVLGFVTAQQRARVGAENVARISDGGSGLSAATVRLERESGMADPVEIDADLARGALVGVSH